MNSRLHPSNGDTKPCPQCRDTLVFNRHYPLLSVGMRTDTDVRGGIRYERAWVCRNGGCDYRELVGDA
jgi:hypothetical protein